MVVWVQLPGFPVHFYHKKLLFTLGNLIGGTIKLDYHTEHQQRAKFGRMAVEVDLSKPLVPRIRVDGRWPTAGEASTSKPIQEATIPLGPSSTANGSQPATASPISHVKAPEPINQTGLITHTISGANGTKIQIVEVQPYKSIPPRITDPEAPSVVARMKTKKEGKGGKSNRSSTPKKGTPIHNNPLKPLQIWSPEWTEMSKIGASAEPALGTVAEADKTSMEVIRKDGDSPVLP
ncbi:unnamed protein product [Linum trigynum]|uniref:DUF4283 domain-containing protein n=1 Tax=Linum trigynum TaxID=586398 RepID=A0AAV2DEN7_9ROSI